jgi:hypothetical protein
MSYSSSRSASAAMLSKNVNMKMKIEDMRHRGRRVCICGKKSKYSVLKT